MERSGGFYGLPPPRERRIIIGSQENALNHSLAHMTGAERGQACPSDPMRLRRNRVCPLCSSMEESWFVSCGRDIRRCKACGFIWVAEGLARDDKGQSIYEGDKPIFFEDGNAEYYLGPASFANARAKLNLVKRVIPYGTRLLDVGAGFGHFVKLAQEHYVAYGLEISPTAAAWGRKEFGAKIITGGLDSSAPEFAEAFDAVTMWDVIEHLEEPQSALLTIKSRLKPRGHLILSTPDAGSLAARILGRKWYYLDPIQHISLFNRSNLSTLLGGAGFTVLSVKSMGHAFQIGYILSRLGYFYDTGLVGAALRGARYALSPLRERHLYINPRDVLVLIAVQQSA